MNIFNIKNMTIILIATFFVACGGSSDDTNADTNNKPTITNLVSNVSLDDNTTQNITFNINDIDGDNLILNIDTNDTSLSISKNFTNPILQANYTNQTLDFNITSDYNISKTVKITISVSDGEDNISKSIDVNITNTVPQVFKSGDTWKGLVYNTVTSPYTNKVWLDRNLGALEVCTKSRDDGSFSDDASYVASQENCFGDYYQWGRNSDGHEKKDSNTTSTQASDLNNTNSSFITSNDTYDYDWAKDADANGSIRSANWSKTDGSSVCPIGFRVPTIDELKAETIDLTGDADVQNRADAFASFLKLPSAGGRFSLSGSLYDQGSYGVLWSSSVDGSYSRLLYFGSSNADWDNGDRAYGPSLRCVRD